MVVGPGRSGSTILDRLLAARGVAAVGELVHVWHEVGVENQLCGCGVRAQDCPFWSGVLSDALGPDWVQRCGELEALRLTAGTYRSWPAMIALPRRWARSVAPLVEATRALVAAIDDRVGPAAVVWDSSKSPTQARLLALAGADPTIVLLTREPAAVAYSWGRPKSRPEAGGRPMPRHGVVGSSLRWSFSVVSGMVEAARLRQSLPELRYRALAGAVDAVVAPTPVGAAVAAPGHQPGAGPAWSHAIGGNPVRWDAFATSFVPDERWRQGLSTVDRYRAGLLAAPGLAAVGVARLVGWSRPVTAPGGKR